LIYSLSSDLVDHTLLFCIKPSIVPGVCACTYSAGLPGVEHAVLILDKSNKVPEFETPLGGSWGDEALICNSNDAADSSSGVLRGERRAELAIGPKFSAGGACGDRMG
jgi:hypothetical protein